jgi:hypothetical protein
MVTGMSAQDVSKKARPTQKHRKRNKLGLKTEKKSLEIDSPAPLTGGEVCETLAGHVEAEQGSPPTGGKQMKQKCTECNKKRNTFAVDKAGQVIQACSNCITEQLLTGWSK